MIPGKQYKPEDYLEIVWRRKWSVIVPFVLIAGGTLLGTQFLPNIYRSEARILIVPQQVPENFVQPTVTTRLDARLQASRFKAARVSSGSSRISISTRMSAERC
jgi:uncharacterized protein involved in exopolysaccharide biosynthesis